MFSINSLTVGEEEDMEDMEQEDVPINEEDTRGHDSQQQSMVPCITLFNAHLGLIIVFN